MRGARLACLLLGLGVAACSAKSTDCPQAQPCDTARRSCQRQILRVAACLRGTDDIPPVTVDVFDKQSFIDEATRDTAAEPIDRQQQLLRRGYALFWLSPWQITDVATQRQQLDNTAAFYDGGADRIVIFRDGERVDPYASLILLHEFVHALQDADPAVAALHIDSTESFLAARALIEGEATLLEIIARAEAAGYALDDVDFGQAFWNEVWSSRRHAGRSNNLASDAYWTFTYAEGAHYLYPAWRRDGTRGLAKVWQQPPRTSRQILAGVDAPPPSGGWSEDITAVAGPRLGPAYRLVQEDTLGQWYFQRYLDLLRNQGCPIAAESTAVSADRFSIWQDLRDGTIVAAWRVRVADAAALLESKLVAELQLCFARQLNVVFAQQDRDLLIVAGDRPDRAPVVLGWGPIEIDTACPARDPGRPAAHSPVADGCRSPFTLPR